MAVDFWPSIGAALAQVQRAVPGARSEAWPGREFARACVPVGISGSLFEYSNREHVYVRRNRRR